MSLAGDTHVPSISFLPVLPITSDASSSPLDVGEAGIFSTVSVPTLSRNPLEQASTVAVTQAGLGGSGLITPESNTVPRVVGPTTTALPSATLGAQESSGSSVSGVASTSASLGSAPSLAKPVLESSQSLAISSSTTIASDIVSSSPSTAPLPLDGQTSTRFTTVSATSTFLAPGEEASSNVAPQAGSEHMVNNANILKPESKLFPLGLVVVIVGSIVMIAIAALVAWKISRCRKRNKLGDRILSFSPDMRDATPYPFDAKAMNDLESRYPVRPRRIDLNSPQDLSHDAVPGIASTRPLRLLAHPLGIDGYYNNITRVNPIQADPRPDTFTCAMFPAGSCPLEYERERQNQQALGLTSQRRSGSPVPSFHTGRLSDPIDAKVQPNRKLLTPPQPRYKSKHIPPPLLITPSFTQGTNSIRGFTPRRSNTNSTVSSGSVYTAI